MSNLSTQAIPRELIARLIQDDEVQLAIQKAWQRYATATTDHLIAGTFQADAATEVSPALPEKSQAPLPDKYELNPWGYAVVAGLIGLFCADEPGGLAGWQGYLLGFVGVFLSIGCLEVSVQRRRIQQRIREQR